MQYVPDYFVKQQQLRHFYDGDDKFFSRLKWYEGSQKTEGSKSKNKRQTLTCCLEQWWDWCVTEDEKKKQKNCGPKNGPFLCLMAGYKIFFTP